MDNARRQWLPSRGPVRFDALLPLDVLLQAFAAEFRRVRVSETDRTGFMTAWGWLFPQRAFDRLVAAGVHYGHRPEPTVPLGDDT